MSSYSTYYTYIAQCDDGTYYVGQTNNLKRRFKQHNGVLIGGARYTHTRRPVTCRYFEEWNTRSIAMHREYVLKKLTHQQKEKMCNSFEIFSE